jgi:isocitrate lyase
MTSYASDKMAAKMWETLKKCKESGGHSRTFGALDPVQVVTMAPELTSIYVSGWQSSSTASTSNEPGPDFADYPMTTVPNKVDQLFRALQHHDRRVWEESCRDSTVDQPDFMTPIIADGDTGHGGLTAVMKLTKMFIEAGAAGIHFEDQAPGTKKCAARALDTPRAHGHSRCVAASSLRSRTHALLRCGHMGGKVLVPSREHCDRLAAARLQADIMGTSTLVVARTDAEAATFITSNIDPRDHAFIMGATVANPLSGTPLEASTLNDSLSVASSKGLDLEAVTKEWADAAKLETFPDAVRKVAQKEGCNARDITAFEEVVANGRGIDSMRAAAEKMLGDRTPYFDWEAPRAKEGYYRLQPGTKMAIARAKAYAPHADLLWMETAKPILSQADEFAAGVHASFPGKFLAYNLSPSFNWDAAEMSDHQIEAFTNELGKRGFVWQFITLAGFHANGLMMHEFVKAYASNGMRAYVEMIQRQEREKGVPLLRHQHWSGAELMDQQVAVATGGGSSTASMGAGVTEMQFEAGEEEGIKSTATTRTAAKSSKAKARVPTSFDDPTIDLPFYAKRKPYANHTRIYSSIDEPYYLRNNKGVPSSMDAL